MSEVKTDSVVNVSGDSDSGIDLSTNDVVAIKTGDTERMRVDSTGRVAIGTTTPHTADSVLTLQNSDGVAELNITSGTSGASLINLGDTADYNIGRIKYDQSNNSLQFNTSNAEGMRLSTNGYLQVGQATSNNPGQGNSVYGLSLRGDGRVFASADGTYSLGLNRSNNGELTNFSRAGSFVGSINVTSSSTSYNTSSDHRLKQNVVDMTGAITRVKSLTPKRFDFISDAGNTVDGFLAHEAQTVVPEAVTGTHNEVDDDGNPKYQQIDQSKLVPLLVGALQEAIAKIETLETKVTALENA